MILTFYFYTDRFQLSNCFLSAGSNSHLNYGQRGIKLELDEKGLYITVFNCFVFKTNVVNSRLNESLNDTSYCEKAVPKSGFL